MKSLYNQHRAEVEWQCVEQGGPSNGGFILCGNYLVQLIHFTDEKSLAERVCFQLSLAI